MSATNFKTENNTYRKMIGNGLTYRIPRFQRDYSWTEEEWEDLWTDILGTIAENGEPAHYMGYLVLQSPDEKIFDVIDGQQRLTTITLIVLAVLKNLKRLIDENNQAEKNQQRMEQIRQTYIGYLDPVTLISRSKLSLNRNNDHYFQNYLVPLERLPQRGFRASEHSLRKAFEWFEKRVRDYAKKFGGDEGVALATLVETMSDRLFFTVINVTDELNAYKVFETLNARGVRLSSTDLLKNYLFSVLHREQEHDHEMKALEDRWEAMVSRLGSESFPDFLRTHWISCNAFVRQSELFKTIRTRVNTRKAVFDLLRNMEQDMDAYLGLTNPEASNWPAEHKNYAQNLRMFGVRQPFSMLIAAHRKLSSDEFAVILRSCVVISLRYNVIGNLPTNEQESVYHKVAQKISNGELSSVSEALAALSGVYPSDEVFRIAFAEKTIRTSDSRNLRIVRYLLCALDKHAGGQDYDFESDTFNVEHVLPQNPQAGWSAFTPEEAEALCYRIGNMALLNRGQNRDIGNAEYAEKRPVLAASAFVLTKKLAEENAEWVPERIAARQKALAKIATSIWRIAQLS
jgi:Protein of unknown function DUF262/Protein of unknown function (DUF1524)